MNQSPGSFMNNVGYRGMGLGHNDGNYVLNNTGISIPRNIPPSLSPVFLGSNGPYLGLLPTAMESFVNQTLHSNSRWLENNGSQVGNKNQFLLVLDKIQSGEDTRTTLMIKNIPNKYDYLTLINAVY